MRTMLIVLATILLYGCSTVVIEKPFTDTALSDQEKASMRGTWQTGNAVVYVDFTSNGIPRMASVDWQDDQFQIVNHDLHIIGVSNTHYLTISADPGNAEAGYLFAEFKSDDRVLLVWAADVDFFKTQVEEEDLKGTVTRKDKAYQVRIDISPEDLLELLRTTPEAINYRDPLIFRKID